MKHKNYFALAIYFFIVTILVLLAQPPIFSQPLIPLSMSTSDLESWMGGVFYPTTGIVYVFGIITNLIWFFKAEKSRFTKAIDVLSTGTFWWVLFIVYIILSIIIFVAISFLSGLMSNSGSMETLLWVPLFIVLDGILLFWLPTALATPRSLRYIPPLSMQLRKLYGG